MTNSTDTNIYNNISDAVSAAAPQWGVTDFEKVKDSLIDCRAKERIPQNTKSVIICVFPYLLDSSEYKGLNISKYAAVADYHTVINARLSAVCEDLRAAFPGEEFTCFADNSPIPEVFCAVDSGLGVYGRNGLFISRKYGSFVFLGEILTTVKLEPTGTGDGKTCLDCGACIRACPGGAIGEKGVDTQKCLSHINQKKGALTPEEIRLIKESGCAWGCDVCQNVCPMNKNAEKTEIEEFLNSVLPEAKPGLPLEGRAYAWRGRSVIERNLSIIGDCSE